MAFETNVLTAFPFNKPHRKKGKSAMQKALNFSSLQASPYQETKPGEGMGKVKQNDQEAGAPYKEKLNHSELSFV